MCLIKSSELKKTETDIICYKIIDKIDGKYFTHYQRAEVEIGKTYHSILNRLDSQNIIHKGLHSFKNLEDAKKLASFIVNKETTIVKCIIPIDSMYSEGVFRTFDNVYTSYASDTLIYVKKLYWKKYYKLLIKFLKYLCA
jgi:hypothetical protein